MPLARLNADLAGDDARAGAGVKPGVEAGEACVHGTLQKGDICAMARGLPHPREKLGALGSPPPSPALDQTELGAHRCPPLSIGTDCLRTRLDFAVSRELPSTSPHSESSPLAFGTGKIISALISGAFLPFFFPLHCFLQYENSAKTRPLTCSKHQHLLASQNSNRNKRINFITKCHREGVPLVFLLDWKKRSSSCCPLDATVS